jgi:hypothetical protein
VIYRDLPTVSQLNQQKKCALRRISFAELLPTTTYSTFVAAIAGLYWLALHAVVSVKNRYASLQR